MPLDTGKDMSVRFTKSVTEDKVTVDGQGSALLPKLISGEVRVSDAEESVV